MANNNVQNVRFLRNGQIFTGATARSDARAALETNKGLGGDGTAILARYMGTEDTYVKTIVGFIYVSGETKNVTIFDIDDVGSDVQKAIDEINTKIGTGITIANTATAQLEALSGGTNDTSASTSVKGAKIYASAYTESKISGLDFSGVTTGTGVYVTNVTETDGVVSATTATLPTVAAISEAGKPITAVSESLGSIFATAGAINAEFVNIADSGNKFTATTVEGALAEIATEIDGMDLAVVSGDGEVITAVSETDGKVSASKAAIKDVKLTGYVKNTTATGAISATDDIEDALSKLENTIGSNAISNADGSITVTPANGSTTDVKVHIKSGEKVIKLDGNGGGIYTNLNLVEITDETTLPAEIKVRYELRDSDGVKIGESIDIPKDSHIVSITYNESTQKLVYTYIDVEGKTQTTEIDLSHLILETEFASGVTFSNGVAHGVVDPTSENFLTVGDNGFKLAGVQDAIDTAISGLDASVSASTAHVTVKVDEVDGKLTAVTLTESDIANKTDLDTLSGKTVTAVEMTGGTAAIAANSTDGTEKITINTDGSQILMTGYAKGGASGAVEATDSINAAIGKLENQIAGKVDALDATVSGQSADGKVKVQVVQENGVLTAVTVTGTDIASADALAAEIAARKAVDGQTGQTYAANTEKVYISDARSLNDADIKLNDALASLDADVIKSVKVNNVALAEASNAVNVQISSAPATGTDASPIVVNTNNSTGAVTLQILQIDCGEY